LNIFGKNIQLSQNYNDCTIKIQDSTYKCHKVLLVSSGKFFKNLFLLGFIESLDKDMIHLGNINAKIFEYILCFVYFEEEFANIPTNLLKEEDWISLLKTAQYLTLYKLQSLCENSLVQILTPENVCFLLDLSIIYHFETLEKGCLAYIASNYYSIDLKKELIQYTTTTKNARNDDLLIRVRGYCEQMKFHIYQKGVVFKNCQTENHGLHDILFGNTQNKGEAKVKSIFDREIEECKLNTFTDNIRFKKLLAKCLFLYVLKMLKYTNFPILYV